MKQTRAVQPETVEMEAMEATEVAMEATEAAKRCRVCQIPCTSPSVVLSKLHFKKQCHQLDQVDQSKSYTVRQHAELHAYSQLLYSQSRV
jgi:hypothetical protein